MKLWLTRQGNGLYMLTMFKPVIEQVYGSSTKDVYVIPGEPIGIRNLCHRILLVINFPIESKKLKIYESIQIELNGNVLSEEIF